MAIARPLSRTLLHSLHETYVTMYPGLFRRGDGAEWYGVIRSSIRQAPRKIRDARPTESGVSEARCERLLAEPFLRVQVVVHAAVPTA